MSEAKLMSIHDINPYIRFVRHFRLNEGFSFINRRIYDYHFIYIYDGRAHVEVEGERYIAQKGDVCFWGPKIKHSLINNGPMPLSMISIRFNFTQVDYDRDVYEFNLREGEEYDEKIVEMVAFSDFEGFSHYTQISDYEKIEKVLKEMVEVYDTKERFYELKLKGLFTIFISEIMRAEMVGGDENKKPNQTIRKLMKYVEKNYRQNITNDFLASKFNYNHNHLNRLMKKHSGMSINHYITNVKINKSIELLNTTDMKINEIANAIGYSDMNYYCRVFKKKTGVSPTKYRQL